MTLKREKILTINMQKYSLKKLKHSEKLTTVFHYIQRGKASLKRQKAAL